MAAKKPVVVKFHEAIYPEAAIRAAAREYAGFAHFRISRAGKYTRVAMRPAGGGRAPAFLAEEFANFALFSAR